MTTLSSCGSLQSFLEDVHKTYRSHAKDPNDVNKIKRVQIFWDYGLTSSPIDLKDCKKINGKFENLSRNSMINHQLHAQKKFFNLLFGNENNHDHYLCPEKHKTSLKKRLPKNCKTVGGFEFAFEQSDTVTFFALLQSKAFYLKGNTVTHIKFEKTKDEQAVVKAQALNCRYTKPIRPLFNDLLEPL